MAIRSRTRPYLVSAEYGSFVQPRDWFIREVGQAGSGVRMVLSGHIHRFGLLVAYFREGDPQTRAMRSVNLEEVQGARAGKASKRRNLPVAALRQHDERAGRGATCTRRTGGAAWIRAGRW